MLLVVVLLLLLKVVGMVAFEEQDRAEARHLRGKVFEASGCRIWNAGCKHVALKMVNMHKIM